MLLINTFLPNFFVLWVKDKQSSHASHTIPGLGFPWLILHLHVEWFCFFLAFSDINAGSSGKLLLNYHSKKLIFIQISQLTFMKETKNSLQLPNSTRLKYWHDFICRIAKVKAAEWAAHYMVDVIPFSV